MTRHSLAHRREAETFAFELDGLKYIGTLGRFDSGGEAEIFLNWEKFNGGIDASTRDAAIAASLALQFGCPAETLRKALTRNPNGSASGPLGKFLDLVAESCSTPPTSPKGEIDDTGK